MEQLNKNNMEITTKFNVGDKVLCNNGFNGIITKITINVEENVISLSYKVQSIFDVTENQIEEIESINK